MNQLISTKALTKRYTGAEQAALQDLDMHVGAGEFFGLLGPNGAGKTTLISILTGLLQPTSGAYSILGADQTSGTRALHGKVGIVPQEIALYPSLTAKENLKFFAEMNGVEGDALHNDLPELLDRMGLGRHANKKVSMLSGGMKRMVNLISGILHRPALLFLDEPTVGVDVDSRNRIVSLLKDLNAEGMTIFYTSHLMEEAEQLCTQVAILNRGRMVCQGSPAELIRAQPQATTLEHVYLQAVQEHA
ncbi:MAG: ABC transporter ATP-binding protein [Flavobacteriales bacterium]